MQSVTGGTSTTDCDQATKTDVTSRRPYRERTKRAEYSGLNAVNAPDADGLNTMDTSDTNE